MLDEIKKSFNSVLYERTTSPFYGTLICAWVIWNWKIFYLTFFISADKIPVNKIEFILTNYSDGLHIVWYPLLSTILLLTLIPFVTNGAYWLSIIFNKWKIDKKNEVDRLQLLSLEQSIDLREQMSKQGEIFDKMIEKQSLEIKQLNALLDEYKSKSVNPVAIDDKNVTTKEKEEEFNNTLEEKEFDMVYSQIKAKGYRPHYENIINAIRSGYKLIDNENYIPSKLITLLETYDIILPLGRGVYSFSDKGKRFSKLMISN